MKKSKPPSPRLRPWSKPPKKSMLRLALMRFPSLNWSNSMKKLRKNLKRPFVFMKMKSMSASLWSLSQRRSKESKRRSKMSSASKKLPTSHIKRLSRLKKRSLTLLRREKRKSLSSLRKKLLSRRSSRLRQKLLPNTQHKSPHGRTK